MTIEPGRFVIKIAYHGRRVNQRGKSPRCLGVGTSAEGQVNRAIGGAAIHAVPHRKTGTGRIENCEYKG